MKIITIPSKIETFPEGHRAPSVDIDQVYNHFDANGNEVMVYLWARWPDYDMIFGLPAESSSRYEKEFGYFEFRKLKEDGSQSSWSLYADQQELKDLVEGFYGITAMSQQIRPEEWKTFNAKQQ